MKRLSALIDRVRRAYAAFPDARRSNVHSSMANIALSAILLFFRQNAPFLLRRRLLEESGQIAIDRTLIAMRVSMERSPPTITFASCSTRWHPLISNLPSGAGWRPSLP